MSSKMMLIGHFRVPPGLCIKTRSSAQPLIRKWFFILMQIKLIFTRKVLQLASFWKWGFMELGSGLLLWTKFGKKNVKWYRRPFMAIFKDFYSDSKKSIHDCTITLSFSLHPWFTTLNNMSSLFKSVAYKLLPTPGHHQHVTINSTLP